MKKLVFLLTLTIVTLHSTFAQEVEIKCGNEQLSVSETPINNPETACFNVDLVMQNCTPVYVRMNFHFFTDDACTGNVQILNSAQTNAYKEAEKLVNDANTTLANNVVQWNGNTATLPCNPIRYVLSGVYIHCRTGAVGGLSAQGLHNTFAVNPSTEMNAYVVAGTGETGVGFSKFISISWMNTGNFNHEVGHTFTLGHSWFNDGCNDTENVTHEWDRNCNGIIESNEKNLQCWNIVNLSTPVDCGKYAQGKASEADANINGVHDCKEADGIIECNPQAPQGPACQNRPCCDWAYINNNVMAYNAYQNSYSECQIRKMLTDLANADCGFVQTVGGCPPPSAFITQTPSDNKNTSFCSECIILEASFNDFKHSYRIIEVATGIEVVNTGWVMGKVKNYCFSTASVIGSGGIPQGGNYLKPNTMYRIELTVASECGVEDFTDFTFKTPGTDCSHPDPGNGGSMRVNPNPATDQIIVEFNAASAEKVSIFSVNTLTSQVSTMATDYNCTDGVNQLQLNVSQLSPGNHRLMLVSPSRFEYINFSKF